MILSEHFANLTKPRNLNEVMAEIAEEQKKKQDRKH
jgi:hypothetical protein